MEQLVMAIALPLLKQYTMNEALEIAYERLGIAAPEKQDPFIYGMNQPFSAGNLTNMLKRVGIRSGANMLMNNLPSGILPLVGITGAATLANKYRKQLTGYDTQTAYEAARQERIADKRLDKITDRIISGKDYGNYEEALLDSSAGAVEIDGTIYSGPDYQGGDNNNNNGSTGSTGSKSGKDNSKGGMGTASFGQSFHARRGGIASL